LAGSAGFFSGGVFGFGEWSGEDLEKKQVFGFQVAGFSISVEEAWWIEAEACWVSVAEFFLL
jgi:hypothetical protein